ncbi:hypothetical protein GCM10010245_88620 [Streptomyces spectabilis]|nr:hypothetical protein GCM10010245_88620 [Streptomyces spectabilis]
MLICSVRTSCQAKAHSAVWKGVAGWRSAGRSDTDGCQELLTPWRRGRKEVTVMVSPGSGHGASAGRGRVRASSGRQSGAPRVQVGGCTPRTWWEGVPPHTAPPRRQSVPGPRARIGGLPFGGGNGVG